MTNPNSEKAYILLIYPNIVGKAINFDDFEYTARRVIEIMKTVP